MATGSAAPGADETANSKLATEPALETGKRCRDMVSVAIRALIDLLESAAEDGKVPVVQVRRIGAAVMAAGGPLAAYYSRTENQCDAAFELASIERKRTDFFGRLITHPFEDMLDEPESGIERKLLLQYFAAVRMILGDETHAQLKARSAVIAEEHRNAQGNIEWDSFYSDPESEQVVEQVLVSIARSFRRFEPRKDWFLIVMNSSPSSISLGSNVFVAKKPEEKVTQTFTEAHMARLFGALFASLRPDGMDKAQRNTFLARWGADPEKMIGPLLVEIATLAQRAK